MNVATLATNTASLAIVGSVVYRQLRTRRIEANSLWIRPALFLGLSLALAAASIHLAPGRAWILVLAMPAGIVVGALAGVLVTRATLATSTVRWGSLTVERSRSAALVWIAVFLGGLLARTSLPATPPILYLDVNLASVTALAVAFSLVAAGYYRVIRAQTDAAL